jgi:hypothetical protein
VGARCTMVGAGSSTSFDTPAEVRVPNSWSLLNLECRGEMLGRLQELGTLTSAGVSKLVLLPAPTMVQRAPTFCTGPHEVVTVMVECWLSGMSTLAHPLNTRVHRIRRVGRRIVIDRRFGVGGSA